MSTCAPDANPVDDTGLADDAGSADDAGLADDTCLEGGLDSDFDASDIVGPAQHYRPVELAIERVFGRPPQDVLRSLAGRSLDDMRLAIGRAIGDTVFSSCGTCARIEPGGRRVVDDDEGLKSTRVLRGDCLVLTSDAVPRSIVAVTDGQLLLDADHAVPRRLRGQVGAYRIVRPWQVSQWAVRCLCERYDVRPVRADHRRARHRGRHQKAVERVFRLPFARLVDNLLFAGEGIDYVTGRRRDPVDVLDRVECTVRSVYAHPRLRLDRRNLRATLLGALLERSQALTLTFHLRADLPAHLVDVVD